MERSGRAEVEMGAEAPGEPHVTARATPLDRGDSHLAGVASIVLDNSFAVGNVGVLQGSNGMFVTMPSYKVGDKYRDVCFPVTKEFREKVNDAVLEAYQQAKEKAVHEGKERASQQIQVSDREPAKRSGEPGAFR